MSGADPVRAAEQAARTSYGRLLALLAATTHDLAAAEDALADAFERALRTWPERGVPERPDAWLLTTARNRMRDRWGSAEARRTRALDPDVHAPAHLDDVDPDAIGDHRLALLCACAHPAVDPAAHTPLMLNTVLGHTAAHIGRAFSVPPATMSTRLTRAKRRIREAGIPFAVPDRDELPDRLAAVLEAVYGAYAIDYTTGRTERGLPEAVDLAESLVEVVPHDAEALGLAALIDFSAARRPASRDASGRFVPLDEQDVSRWDRDLIARGRAHLAAAYERQDLGRYQLEAAIQAVHCARLDRVERADPAATDGGLGCGPDGASATVPPPETSAAVSPPETSTASTASTPSTTMTTLVELHETLFALAPTLGAGTSLAVAVGDLRGPQAGLAVLDRLGDATGLSPDHLRRHQPTWAARAHLEALAGRPGESVAAYDKAISLTQDPAERAWLTDRRERVIARDGA